MRGGGVAAAQLQIRSTSSWQELQAAPAKAKRQQGTSPGRLERSAASMP
jgi:hypothetical protein